MYIFSFYLFISLFFFFFFFNDTATTEIYTLSLHDALPICNPFINAGAIVVCDILVSGFPSPKEHVLSFTRRLSNSFTIDYNRSEEHTSELQSRPHLVCRLLLEKKKKKKNKTKKTQKKS